MKQTAGVWIRLLERLYDFRDDPILRVIDGVATNVHAWSKRTGKPTVAGILDIVVGTFRAFVGLLLITVYMSCPPSPGFPMSGSLLAWLAAICYMVIGVLAIVGGIYALRSKKWGRALIGSICAALSVLVIPVVVLNLNWLLYGSIFAPFDVLGILAIALTALSKGEFE